MGDTVANKSKTKDDTKEAVSSGKGQALQLAVDQIEKQFGKGAVMKLGDNARMRVDALSTGILPLDVADPAQEAAVFEAIDYKLYSWPGHGVAKEASYQYNEKEWMLADEYDHLISDPSDYLLRKYLPRTVGAFAG